MCVKALEYAGVFERVVEDGFLHGREDQSDVGGVRGLGQAASSGQPRHFDFKPFCCEAPLTEGRGSGEPG